jgi:hypothetical protein
MAVGEPEGEASVMATIRTIQTDIGIWYPTVYNSQRKVAVDSTGRIWVTYMRLMAVTAGGNYEMICAAYSDDGGATWTEEQVTDLQANQQQPSIAIDSDDVVHLVWTGTGWGVHTARYNIQYCKRDGGAWGAVTQLTDIDTPPGQNYPVIAVDSDDYLHVAWTGDGHGVNTGFVNVVYRQYTDAWQAVESVTDLAGESQLGTSIAIDSDDVVHLVWSGTGWGVESGFYNIQYRQRTGAGWQAQEGVTDEDDHQQHCCLAVAPSGVAHVVWDFGAIHGSTNIRYRQRTGAGWQVRETVTDEDTYQMEPVISLGGGAIHVAWAWEYDDGADFWIDTAYRKRTGGSWSAVEMLTGSEDGYLHYYHSAAHDRPCFLWTREYDPDWPDTYHVLFACVALGRPRVYASVIG